MDDLSLALGEHGVNVNKPDYCESMNHLYADEVGTDVQIYNSSQMGFDRPRRSSVRFIPAVLEPHAAP